MLYLDICYHDVQFWEECKPCSMFDSVPMQDHSQNLIFVLVHSKLQGDKDSQNKNDDPSRVASSTTEIAASRFEKWLFQILLW